MKGLETADAEDAANLRAFFSDFVTHNSKNVAFISFPEDFDFSGYKWTHMDSVKYD